MNKNEHNKSTGIVGLTYEDDRDRYKVTCKYQGKLYNIGRADTIQEGIEMREKWIKENVK